MSPIIAKKTILLSVLLLLACGGNVLAANRLPAQNKPKTNKLLEQEVGKANEDTLSDTTSNVDGPPQEAPFVNTPEIELVEEPTVYDPLNPSEDPNATTAPFVQAPILRPSDLPSDPPEPPKERILKDLMEKQANGTYLYKIRKKSTSDHTTTFKIGAMTSPQISTRFEDSVSGAEVTFKEFYTPNPVPLLMYEYEWIPKKDWVNLRAIGGIGMFFAQGKGRFSNGEEAREKFTFIGLPIFAGGVYRLHMGNAWLAPFVTGGAAYYGMLELRDDGKKRNIVGAPAAYGGGGVMFDITHFDREASFTFDKEYGVNRVWVSLEGRVVQSFSKVLDFSSQLVFLGVSADY